VGNTVVSALARELVGTDSSESFALVVRRALCEEFGLDDAELVAYENGTGATLRAVPDRVPPEVADAVVDLWLVARRVERLAHDASHDPLTGLRNRRSFDAELARAVAGAERYGWTFCVVLVDLDGLKRINDEHGHAVGDAVLRSFGSELSQSVRREDIAARIGGDEFGLIIREADSERVHELLDRVTRLVNLSLTGLTISMSAGQARVPEDGFDPEALYRLADERLYRSKRG
jgi:diguanylate cyclase (GGDEF)-like protein